MNGYKDIENRDWPTRITGRVYVHAGKKVDRDAIGYILKVRPDIPLPLTFETGGIVGSVVIAGCTEEHDSEWFFGDYGFILEQPQVLPFRHYRGQLGFFEVPA